MQIALQYALKPYPATSVDEPLDGSSAEDARIPECQHTDLVSIGLIENA
jgi:hypothetical protein